MFLQDLYLLAFDCAEVRTAFLHLRNQVFKKGFDDWKPIFKFKCLNPKCNKEFQERIDKCDKCGGNQFREPDADQYVDFDKFRTNCNIFGNSLEEVLKVCEDDANVCLIPGTLVYRQDGKKGQGYQAIETIKVGDKVYTHQGRARKVLRTYQRFVDEDLIVLNLENKEIIKVTGNHPIYTKRGWVRADELNLEDILYKLSDFKKFSNNMTSEERYEKCILPSAKTRKGKKRGKYNCISPRKGLTLVEYLGAEKAKVRELKWKETLHKNGTNIGFGFNFRSKRGDFKGANNPNWQDGSSITSYSYEFTKTKKRKIFERDNFICQKCLSYPNNSLTAHHIDYDKKNADEHNLITLCRSCNSKVNINRDFWKEYFSDLIEKKYVAITNGTKILRIGREHYIGMVYNLEVEEDNSYCGKGIIYHNCDDSYLYLNTQYKRADKLYGQVIEIRRIHPALIEIDLDKNGIPKNSHWICLFHRDQIYTEKGICKECQEKLIPVMYVYNHRGRRLYVAENEMIHMSKFSPSETYGYSMLLTIMQKVLTLSGMDRFLYRYFFERKAPTGMILTYTDDPQSLEVERARVESKMMEDPTYMPWVAVSQRTGRGRTDFVRLFHTLQEMDYIPVRNEIRDRISAAYGVPQMYMNVMEGVGGISASPFTPIYIRKDKKFIDIVPIASLKNVNTPTKQDLEKQGLEVWTLSGWKLLKAVYRHPNPIYQKRYNQKSYSYWKPKKNRVLVVTGSGALDITPDHSVMLEDGGWGARKDISEKTLLRQHLFVDKNDYKTMLEDFAWLLGFWCAEGSLNTPSSVSLVNKNRGLLERAKVIIDSTYLVESKIWFNKEDQVYYLNTNCAQFAKDVLQMCSGKFSRTPWLSKVRKSYHYKRVPAKVLNGAETVKKAFLEGYYAGDGNQPPENSNETTMSSIDGVLAAGIKYLYRCLGYEVGVDARIGDSGAIVYSLRVFAESIKSHPKYQPNEVKKLVDFTRKENVYDIETDDNTFVEALGDIVLHNSGQTQQLKVFSDVIQADQRMYNEKVFPILLKAFGITDWKLQLRPPEEKVEGEILQLASQKVNIASQMRMMGFDVELKPECKDIVTLDFTFSGKAQPMAGPMGGMFGGGEGGMPIPAEGVPGSEESQEGPVWDRKIPAEEKVFEPSSEESEENEEKSDQEHKVFNVKE